MDYNIIVLIYVKNQQHLFLTISWNIYIIFYYSKKIKPVYCFYNFVILLLSSIFSIKMKVNLDNRKFVAIYNSANGEVSELTIFHYHQQDDLVWAEYSGGQIVKGNIIGKVVDDHIEFSYLHINTENEIMTGKCKSYPELIENGKIKLKEFWEWTSGDKSSGESIVIEV